MALGTGTAATTTKLAFTYIGALLQARKQFIPGFFFFKNLHYNWLGGAKYILMGFVLGNCVSCLNFGHPYLLEDYIRNKFRHWLTKPATEQGFVSLYFTILKFLVM